MRKAIASFLSFVLLISLCAVPVFAESNDKDQAIGQIDQALNELRSAEPITPADQELNDKAASTAAELKDQLRFNKDTIYDLDSIPARIELFVVLCKAMRFGTTELANKIDAAHNKLAGWITVGLLQTVNPFANIGDLKAYGAEFEALQQELLSFPDLGPNDSATLYTRAKLDDLLTKARFLKFNELADKSNVVIQKLDKLILEITGIRLKPQATVAEIEDASARLQAAMDEAIASKDVKAGQADLAKLREMKAKVNAAIKEMKKNGQETFEARELVNKMTKALLTIRVSKALVEDLLQQAQAYLPAPVVVVTP